jgi:hypothetical protein
LLRPNGPAMARSGGTYQLDPGSYTGSIHAYAKDDSSFPTCDNNALLGNVAIHAVVDQTAILLIHAPKGGDLRTLFIPLDNQPKFPG